jgi:hypothetical protein
VVSDPSPRLFLFVQCELPWALGPPAGRYLLRSPADGGPERVIVLGTLGARRPAGADRRPIASVARRGRRRAQPEPKAPLVEVIRATVVDPVPVAIERQARAWLADFDAGRDVAAAFDALNRMLYAWRIAAADPHTHAVSPEQALVVRAGWGEGEQVADGQWLHAVELSPRAISDALADVRRGESRPKRSATRIGRRRAGALRADERLARQLAGHEAPLLCEELALRARADFDQGRLRHAALELDHALSAALSELADERRADLPLRLAELRSLQPGVSAIARTALSNGRTDDRDRFGEKLAIGADVGEKLAVGADVGEKLALGAEVGEKSGSGGSPQERVGHALGRLEAALRARAALASGGG